MPPLNPEDYAPGRTIRHQGEEVTISDTLVSGSGSRFLVASPQGSAFSALLPESVVRDNESDDFEAVDPEDVRGPDTEATDATEDPDRSPGGTNPDESPSPDRQ